MQEENHEKIMVQRDSNAENQVVFVISVPKTVLTSQRPTYQHCGKKGCKEQNCFEIIGYLAGWVLQRGGYSCGRDHKARGG